MIHAFFVHSMTSQKSDHIKIKIPPSDLSSFKLLKSHLAFSSSPIKNSYPLSKGIGSPIVSES